MEHVLGSPQQSNGSGYSGTKVLVTGADGFIGSHLTEHLVALRADVTALAQYNSFDAHGWLDELPIEVTSKLKIVRGDVRDAAFVSRLLAEQDIVFHLAALISIPHSYIAAQSYVDTNIIGSLNVLEAAREHQVRRVVQTSTSEVYGTAMSVPISEAHPLQGQSPYSASKIGADMMAEAYARSFDVPVVVLRPFNTFGPRQSERAVIPTIVRQVLDPDVSTVRLGDTSTSRDFTYVADTVAAFLAIGASPAIEFGRPYNAGSGKAITIGELIELVMTLADRRKPIEQDAGRLRPANSEVRALLADSARFINATGWRPHVDLSEGLVSTIAYWRERFAEKSVRRENTHIA
ncbi:SDR family NAD(P)-dependent oxidoreductase [Mesorhizobium muleiense]|uniref:UDP-glucose 4-epimerase n=1 Tax=Mesorhizobium muleiense TaxID=1004279 RepID=A0A1G8L3M4_9HYPH|nr:SDR family NAD(P)-dependent oxidoreductase [Mesorhizobium muleiense]MCF6100425.1 SDR family NAD(P)-dependent oxidoreductase [Mesorhizobium muleiense]SDI50276.1 UDP-glucose 4-epimerase [Mesorhizobium muleiense]